jgi:hypothetical protein
LAKRIPFTIVFFIALLATASTWFYMLRILKPHQIAYAQAHGQPRGNLSDLYPRWLGARELLLRRRNPYSSEITREIQKGYYGRELDRALAEDPKDQQGFAYPVYVVFLLAPTVHLPFEDVAIGFRWLLILLTGLSVALWLKVLRWKLPCGAMALAVILVLGSLQVVQGIRLQQLSLLVAAMLAGCAACIAYGYIMSAGVLLALATIKPQLAWPLVLWLLFWAVSDWRERKKFVYGFAGAMALLLVGAQILLPGWLGMFLGAIGQYHQYTQNQSVLEVLLGTVVGRIVDGVAFSVGGVLLWGMRREAASSVVFGRAVALVMALTALIVPMSAPYNQALLIPAVLMLVRSAKEEALPAFGLARWIGAVLVAWPWIATLVLSVVYFALSPECAQNAWQLPLYTSLFIPLFVFGLACLDVWAQAAM